MLAFPYAGIVLFRNTQDVTSQEVSTAMLSLIDVAGKDIHLMAHKRNRRLGEVGMA